MTQHFTKRRGQESISIQRLFLKHAHRCTIEACEGTKETPTKIEAEMEWDKLAKVVMESREYEDNPTIAEISFKKNLLDPMMVWMTIAENHLSGAVRDAYLTRAKEHGLLQFYCIAAHFFPHMLDSQAALQEIREALEQAALDWDLQSILPELPWFQSHVGDGDIINFLKAVLGVVGRMKKNRAGDELDNGNEFILRATGWQHECISGWLLNYCMSHQIEVNGDTFFEHLYERNELLAYMVRYFVKGERKTLNQALKACRLGTGALLFRFGNTDHDTIMAHRIIEKQFMSSANQMYYGSSENKRRLINVQDWVSEYREKQVLGAMRVVPILKHTDPKRHLYKVNENFLLDKIRQVTKRLEREKLEAEYSSNDDEGKQMQVEHQDDAGLAPGDDWMDARSMDETNAILEKFIPNIRHRIAYLFKDAWGTVPARWDIPESWLLAFQTKLRYDTPEEVKDLFEQLLVTPAELGMNKEEYRAHRDALKARLFKSNAETVERYFRLGRAALSAGRDQ